jgi:hypothetical protein
MDASQKETLLRRFFAEYEALFNWAFGELGWPQR